VAMKTTPKQAGGLNMRVMCHHQLISFSIGHVHLMSADATCKERQQTLNTWCKSSLQYNSVTMAFAASG